jgi:hypothetical protein
MRPDMMVSEEKASCADVAKAQECHAWTASQLVRLEVWWLGKRFRTVGRKWDFECERSSSRGALLLSGSLCLCDSIFKLAIQSKNREDFNCYLQKSQSDIDRFSIHSFLVRTVFPKWCGGATRGLEFIIWLSLWLQFELLKVRKAGNSVVWAEQTNGIQMSNFLSERWI